MSEHLATFDSGIDRKQLRVLLKTFYTLTMRRRAAQMASARMGRAKKPRGISFIIISYTVLGLIMGSMAFMKIDLILYALMLHAATFFMTGLSILSEAGDILFNVRESDVLGHRPIHPKTLLASKGIYLVGYALISSLSLNLFPAFFGIAALGARVWFPAVHLLTVVLNSLFCASAIVFVYGILYKIFGREKFDDFATWSQVALTIIFSLGYQIMPRLLEPLRSINPKHLLYLLPVPPLWFASMDATVAGTSVPIAFRFVAAGGLVGVAGLAYAAVGKLASSYSEAFTGLREMQASRKPTGGKISLRGGAPGILIRWWLRDPVERSAFQLASAYIFRDREIRLRLYPSLGIYMFWPVLAILNRRTGSQEFFINSALWMAAMCPSLIIGALQYSEQYAAAELFAFTPLAGSAPLFHGVRKAALYYSIPIIAVSLILVSLAKRPTLASLPFFLPALVAVPIFSLLPGYVRSYIPLSRPIVRGEQSARNARRWLVVVFVVFPVLFMYIARALGVEWFFLAIEIVALITLHFVLLARIKQHSMPTAEG